MSDHPLSLGDPEPMRSLSPSFLEQFDPNDESFNNGLVSSPGSRRCPTLKDYTERIKQLQHENFQLKVRIYLSEQKAGGKPSSSDMAVFFSQNGVFPTHSITQSSTSTSSASALESLNKELDKVKEDKARLQEKVQDFENDVAHKRKQIAELAEKTSKLEKQNEDIVHKLEKANQKIEELSKIQSPVQSDEEVDKLAAFAFGQTEVEQRNSELETKLQMQVVALKHVQDQVSLSQDKLHYYENKISKMELEKRNSEEKIREMTASLREMGKKFIRLQEKYEKLERKMAEKTKGFESNSYMPTSDSVPKLIELLQHRMRELAEFVETLLHLESQKVVSLTGLTDENRENLLKTIEQARIISESLDAHLEKDSVSDPHHKSIHPYLKDHHHRGLMSPSGAHKSHPRLKSENVQCNILDPSLENSLESANVYINKLKKDIHMMERINGQLGQEKDDLITQVRALESNINFLKLTSTHVSSVPGSSPNKTNEENKKLLKRLLVTEDALKNLHTEHAKLVAELKILRNTYQKSAKGSIGSTIADLNRPSDSTSPDLGIDSGHDGAVNSDDSNGNNYKEENRILRTTNRELAIKLKQTKQALDNTLEKLNSTTKEKEQVEKAICRQLHKTHTILRQAKRSVEKFTSSQCQENIVPQPPPSNS